MERKKAITELLTFVAVVLVASLVSFQLYFRWDFTEDKQYTLSQATRDIIGDLDQVITVKVYFSEGLPPQYTKLQRDLADLLVEYENGSDAYMVYDFVNPNKDEETEREAQRAGINPVLVNVRNRDKVEQMRAYMGAVLYMGNEKEVIPYLEQGSSMEYALTTAAKKLVIEKKPKIALLQGHGEPPVEHMKDLESHLSVLYDLVPFSLPDSAAISDQYKSVVMINPEDTFPSTDFDKLNEYLKQGGNMYIAHSSVKGDMSTAELERAPGIGVTTWLSSLGIRFGREFLVDATCAPVSVAQRQGPFVFNTRVEFPYFPIVRSFGEHPVSKGLEAVLMPFVSSLSVSLRDSTLQVSNLLLTSELTGSVSPPAYIDVQRRWTEDAFNVGPQPVAIAAEGPLHQDGEDNKLVVVANGSFAVNGDPEDNRQQQQQLNPDNVNLAVNAIDWLADDTGLIDLRTKGITSRPIEDLERMEEGTKDWIKYGNVLLPIVLVLGYAFFRHQRKLYYRRKWLESF